MLIYILDTNSTSFARIQNPGENFGLTLELNTQQDCVHIMANNQQ